MEEGGRGIAPRLHQRGALRFESRQDRGLRIGADMWEANPRECLRVLVQVRQAPHEVLALLRVVPLRNDRLDEFRDAGFRRPRRVGGRNDRFGHRVDRLALLRGEEGASREARHTRFHDRSELSRGQAGEGRRCAHHAQQLASIHGPFSSGATSNVGNRWIGGNAA